MRRLIWSIVIFLAFSALPLQSEEPKGQVLAIAEKYIGINQRQHKPQVLDFLESVGFSDGKLHSWCAAFIHYVLIEAGVKPPVRSGVARQYITKKSVKAKHVLKGYEKLDESKLYLVIWQRGTTWKGHIAFAESWNGRQGKTIEGNTSCNDKGSQHSGGSVCRKSRSIVENAYFRITHFTEIE